MASLNFDFRKAHLNDVPVIWDILQQAILRRKKDGSSQWQDGYPDPQTIREDIQSDHAYVLTLDGEIVAYSAVMINNEPAYDDLDGSWLTDGDYVVFHRVAITDKYIGKGLSYKLLEFIEAFARNRGIQSVRADTNYDNLAMLKIFARMGYGYRGEVLMRGSPRRAYEKVLHTGTAAAVQQQGRALPLMEQFYTIQGEGFNTGKAAYFIRLGGCDIGCHWCDVKESWDAAQHPPTTVETIVAQASAFPARTVVVTGGEPLIYNLAPLTDRLHSAGFTTCLETSGAYPLSGRWDWICLSPKKFKSPLPSMLQVAHELKVIIYNKSDFRWAEQHAHLVGPDCLLYLQPEWSRSTEMTPLIIDYVKDHPKWMISLQTHKYLNIP